MIAPEQIEAVRQATDIVEVVSGYLTLRHSGRSYTALCPFHREKTPSFTVNPERQTFKCFGCQEGGNVFGFLMAIEGMTFPEAVRMLADRVGIVLDETARPAPDGPDRARLAEATAFAARLFQEVLHRDPAGAPGREYLKSRGIDAAWSRSWGIGYAPADRQFLLTRAQEAGFTVDELADAGLCYRSDGGPGPGADRFTRRVMFPIWSTRNEIVGFGGRAISEEQRGKYINSAEGPLFHKSRLLYGYDRVNRARREQPELRAAPIYVAEGYLDVIALHAAGIPTAVAPLGTALTVDHVRILRPSGCAVVLVFDGDRAGQEATRRAIAELMRQDVEARVTRPYPGGDPFSLFQEQGAGALRALAEDTVSAYDFVLAAAVAAHGDSVEGRAAAAGDVAEVLGQTSNAVKEDGYIRQAAFDLRFDEGALRKLWRQRKAGRPAEPSGPAPGDGPGSRLGRDGQAERDLAVALLGEPRLVGRAAAEIPLKEIEDPRVRETMSVLYALHERGGEAGATAVVSRLQARGDAATLRFVTDLIAEVDRRVSLRNEGRTDRDRDPFSGLYDGYATHVARRRDEQKRRELKDRMRRALAAEDTEGASGHLAAIAELDRSRRGRPHPEAAPAEGAAEGNREG